MEILWVLLEVLHELVNLLREERDRHVRRAGVSVVPGGTFHHRHLFLVVSMNVPTLPRLVKLRSVAESRNEKLRMRGAFSPGAA